MLENLNTVTNIIVQGNKRLDSNLIIDESQIKTLGFNEKSLSKAVKNLYKSGYFDDVQIFKDENFIYINVKENPVIASAIGANLGDNLGVKWIDTGPSWMALEKETWLKQFNSPEGHLALFGGHTGIDLEGLDYDTPIENINLEGMQHIALKWKGKTINQMLSQRPPTCVGSTKQVVDRMEELISYGVDGFVVHPMIQPQSHEDLVNLIIPELQKRKLFRTKYEHSTLRGNLLRSEDGLSDSNHPSAKYRP